MRALPNQAKAYIFIVYIVAMAAAMSSQLMRSPVTHAPYWERYLFMCLALLAGSRKVTLMRHKAVEDAGSMSLGFAITFAALVRFGPPMGVIVGAFSSLSGCIWPKRQPLYQLIFNVALTIIESWFAGLTFAMVNGSSTDLRVESFGAVAAASLVYFGINTVGVSIVISLCTNQKWLKLWRTTFMWTAPSYFASASISTLACMLFKEQIGAVMVFGMPVVWLTFQSYKVATARTEEKQQHIEELQLSQAHLADLYLATIKSLALAIDAKDQYTHQHILRVQRYPVATPKFMPITDPAPKALNTRPLL